MYVVSSNAISLSLWSVQQCTMYKQMQVATMREYCCGGGGNYIHHEYIHDSRWHSCTLAQANFVVKHPCLLGFTWLAPNISTSH